MSRALVETLLTTDEALAALGIDETSVFNQNDVMERPKNDGPFIIVRWEEVTLSGLAPRLGRGSRLLTIWVHSPKEISTDFNALDEIIEAIDALLLPLENEAGTDGYSITNVRKSGVSGDLYDEGLNTVTRNAGYGVLYHRT